MPGRAHPAGDGIFPLGPESISLEAFSLVIARCSVPPSETQSGPSGFVRGAAAPPQR
jgi:hypothetical protein